jgi:hypothetical protein
MKKTIILLHGKKGSGKDYIGSKIEDWLKSKNQPPLRTALANPIKEILSRTLGLETLYEDINEFKNNPEKYSLLVLNNTSQENISTLNFRTLLTRFGNDVIKEYFGKDIWVNLIIDLINKSEEKFVVITDLRLFEEYKKIKDYCLLNNYRLITFNVLGGDDLDTHITEAGLDINFTYTFDNRNKTITSADVDVIMTLINVGNY